MPVIDKGNGVKVAVTGASSFEDEAQWRMMMYKELQSLNAKAGWFVLLSIITVVMGLMTIFR